MRNRENGWGGSIRIQAAFEDSVEAIRDKNKDTIEGNIASIFARYFPKEIIIFHAESGKEMDNHRIGTFCQYEFISGKREYNYALTE